MFDLDKFRTVSRNDRYPKRIEEVRKLAMNPACIETAVTDAVDNIRQKQTRSFVIYGEPQSGKTEMMIALTARLLDDGHKLIIELLNDSVDLLEQNLDRFQRSGLAPSPCNFSDILDPTINVNDRDLVIFCKKNAKDLKKLIDKISHLDGKVVIDDEADFASPNAKVNKKEKTRINALIESLLGDQGIYVGVTATPARLDLNNTFENDHEKWVDFPPHEKYTGQDIFFPLSDKYKFRITWIPDGAGDDPKWCKDALFGFLINVARLNLHPEVNSGPKNYSMLIHTSGKKEDHRKDYQLIQKIFGTLGNSRNNKYPNYVEAIWTLAQKRYPGEEDELVQYILQNIGCRNIVVMNSDKDLSKNSKSATDPSSLFTIVIGGNIVSRGVTFKNLLSMYFTRDAKHKIQQDTYIQRARMFGDRGDYLPYFELTIPEQLYLDWHRCFIFHRLSLAAIKSSRKAPIWLSDARIGAVAKSSIDNANVSIDHGEMSFGIFDYAPKESLVDAIINSTDSNFSKLEKLHALLGEPHFPKFLLSYIQHFCPNGDASIKIHPSNSIAGSKDADQEKISRAKGFMGGGAFTESSATHHIRILFNERMQARLFYKYSGNIKFLKRSRASVS
jgi:hypothetical protein